MKMINDQGGVNGRKIDLIQYDDAYSPPTLGAGRKLVEGDEVLLTFQIIGTAQHQPCEYLNGKKIATVRRHRRRSSPTRRIFHDVGFQSLFFVEGRILRPIHSEGASGRRGTLYQNDDLGKDYLNGLKAGLGDKAAK